MSIELKDDQRLRLIEKEYFHLESEVGAYDSKALSIKTWSVSLAAAVFGSSAIAAEPLLLLAGAVASVLFLIIEASWKTFQGAHLARLHQIESAFRGETDLKHVLQISTSWKNEHNSFRFKGLLRRMTWHHIYVPHLPLAIIFVGIFFYLKYY